MGALIMPSAQVWQGPTFNMHSTCIRESPPVHAKRLRQGKGKGQGQGHDDPSTVHMARPGFPAPAG